MHGFSELPETFHGKKLIHLDWCQDLQNGGTFLSWQAAAMVCCGRQRSSCWMLRGFPIKAFLFLAVATADFRAMIPAWRLYHAGALAIIPTLSGLDVDCVS